MAENKKSFVMYADYLHTFNELTDEEAGKLIKHLLMYVNDINPILNDRLLKIAFEPIKQQLKRDLKDWELIKEKRSKAGKISAELKKQNSTNSTSVKFVEQNSTNSTVNVNDTVTVNVNDTVINKDISTEKKSIFRDAKIPLKEDVARIFISSGGNYEMAEAFFNKYEALEWYLNGSPIRNFVSLVPSFIKNWQKNNNKNEQRNNIGAKKSNSEARIEAYKNW